MTKVTFPRDMAHSQLVCQIQPEWSFRWWREILAVGYSQKGDMMLDLLPHICVSIQNRYKHVWPDSTLTTLIGVYSVDSFCIWASCWPTDHIADDSDYIFLAGFTHCFLPSNWVNCVCVWLCSVKLVCHSFMYACTFVTPATCPAGACCMSDNKKYTVRKSFDCTITPQWSCSSFDLNHKTKS